MKMVSVLILLGSAISIFCLVFIINDKKKSVEVSGQFIEMESEYRRLKSEMDELVKEFNKTALHSSERLNAKVKEIQEIAFKERISENEILNLKEEIEKLKDSFNELKEKVNTTPTRRKTSKDKIIQLVQNNKEENVETVRKKAFESEIDEFIEKGLSQNEISEKTGKSMGEIEFIMGLRNMR
jgi:seryl-tRNA synthetase